MARQGVKRGEKRGAGSERGWGGVWRPAVVGGGHRGEVRWRGWCALRPRETEGETSEGE